MTRALREHTLRQAQVRVYSDRDAACAAAAERFRELAREAAAAGRRFAVALTGGSAPGPLHARLGAEPLRSTIPWEAVHLFWGDERCVPPAHARSNFGAAWRAGLAGVPLPPENVHRIRGELPPREAAARYADELRACFGDEVPAFDLVYLGVGEDAHVASLFPFSPLLLERERAVATALRLPESEWRVTLTLPALNAARRVEFLAFGEAKRAVVHRVLLGALDPLRLPAQAVRPASGELLWRLDVNAECGSRNAE